MDNNRYCKCGKKIIKFGTARQNGQFHKNFDNAFMCNKCRKAHDILEVALRTIRCFEIQKRFGHCTD